MKTGADAAAANVSMICTHVTIWFGVEPHEALLCIAGIILIEMEPRTCTTLLLPRPDEVSSGS